MQRRERRIHNAGPPDPDALREGLTHAQLRTLGELEHFHWSLRFVRRPMFHDPVPVLFDRENRRYLVIEPDGTINEAPDIKLRD